MAILGSSKVTVGSRRNSFYRGVRMPSYEARLDLLAILLPQLLLPLPVLP